MGALARQKRKQWLLDQNYPNRHQPGMADAVLTFNHKGPLPLKTLHIEGFTTKYCSVYRGSKGIYYVFAVLSRPGPFSWPRTIDVTVDPNTTVRADIDEWLSGDDIGEYTIHNDLNFQMDKPHGVVSWDIVKDKDLIYSRECIYRQDIYQKGEWVKSLVAILNR